MECAPSYVLVGCGLVLGAAIAFDRPRDYDARDAGPEWFRLIVVVWASIVAGVMAISFADFARLLFMPIGAYTVGRVIFAPIARQIRKRLA